MISRSVKRRVENSLGIGVVAVLWWMGAFLDPATAAQVTLVNESYPTLCQEEDNVLLTLHSAGVQRFDVVATHPPYTVVDYTCAATFANCSSESCGEYLWEPDCMEVFNDDTYVVTAYRFGPNPTCHELGASWWRPNGMSTSGPKGPFPDAHMIAVAIKRVDPMSTTWPQVMVCYQDGNTRLKPHRAGSDDICFGTSVLVGPIVPSNCLNRPIAEISSIAAQADRSLLVTYAGGGTATMRVFADQTHALLRVHVGYPTAGGPFAAFRSMFVDESRCDAARLLVRDCSSPVQSCLIPACAPVMGDEFFLHRVIASSHNQAAPDIRILACDPLGDLNCDGAVNGNDIRSFADALLQHVNIASNVCRGDFSDDGLLGTDDIPGLVALLLGS